LRAALRVPVMAAGQLLSAERAAAAIAAGRCDIAAMARPFIADPSWPVKIAQGRGDEVRPCIRANECHMYHGMRAHMTCAVNPEAGREREFAIAPSSRPVRVLVVGGGPAGMQAASVAAQSGHKVTLIEHAEQLGGRLPLIARDPSQHRLADYVAFQRSRLTRLGVEIRLGVDLPAAELVADNPAVVLVATGSSDPEPALGGTADVQTYAAVLAGVPVGRHVLVVGGLEDHLEPLSAADLLATQGHQVVAVTEWDRPAPHADPMTRMALLRRLRRSGVELALGLRVLQMSGRTVQLLDVLTGQPPAQGLVGQWPEFDTVVYCGGRTARTDLLRTLRTVHPRVQAIGDCLAPRRIVHAVLDGQRAGRLYEIGQQHLLRP